MSFIKSNFLACFNFHVLSHLKRPFHHLYFLHNNHINLTKKTYFCFLLTIFLYMSISKTAFFPNREQTMWLTFQASCYPWRACTSAKCTRSLLRKEDCGRHFFPLLKINYRYSEEFASQWSSPVSSTLKLFKDILSLFCSNCFLVFW